MANVLYEFFLNPKDNLEILQSKLSHQNYKFEDLQIPRNEFVKTMEIMKRKRQVFDLFSPLEISILENVYKELESKSRRLLNFFKEIHEEDLKDLQKIGICSFGTIHTATLFQKQVLVKKSFNSIHSD